MNSKYEVLVKIRTPTGYADSGIFSLGTDLDFAWSTFHSFKGDTDDSHDAAIRLCLVEKIGQRSQRQLTSVGCRLNEYAENAKVIARDVFKLLNLK